MHYKENCLELGDMQLYFLTEKAWLSPAFKWVLKANNTAQAGEK